MVEKLLPPEEVLEVAERAENRELPEVHPLLGVEQALDNVLDEDPKLPIRGIPAMPPPPPRMKSYCDSCGYVDDHAHDCPRRIAEDLEREGAREEALERAAAHSLDEPIRTQLRRLAGSLLRRIARAVDGR
jgi:hypothetical protein